LLKGHRTRFFTSRFYSIIATIHEKELLPIIVINNYSFVISALKKINVEENGFEIVLKNSNKSGQRCIYVLLMFSRDVTKQQKIFNGRASQMTK